MIHKSASAMSLEPFNGVLLDQDFILIRFLRSICFYPFRTLGQSPQRFLDPIDVCIVLSTVFWSKRLGFWPGWWGFQPGFSTMTSLPKATTSPKTGRGDNRGMAVIVLDALTRWPPLLHFLCFICLEMLVSLASMYPWERSAVFFFPPFFLY